MGAKRREPSFFRERALGALRELVRGLDAAFRRQGRAHEGLALEPIYDGLVAVIVRLVVLLHAEARDLLTEPGEGAATARPIAALYDELNAEQRRSGDSALEQGRDAWPRLLALFRRIHAERAGASPAPLAPQQRGLFDPDAHPLLEGRTHLTPSNEGETIEAPPIDDGAILRVLSRLIVDGSTKLPYEELDVDPIGAAHEAVMGFTLEVAEGCSIALLPDHTVVDLEALLAAPSEERVARLRRAIDLEPTRRFEASIAAATSVTDLQRALARRASPEEPDIIPRGALYLQPGEARRLAGSYYTPPELTRAVVARTLAPLLTRGDRRASPDEILSLAICDPAMGTGAFLVEACRQLARALEEAWARGEGDLPASPPSPPRACALRLVAERCIYGVDRNPLAVDLAKLSLWIAAGSPSAPMSFLDGRLVCGDSLLGARADDLRSFPLDAFRRRGTQPGESAVLASLYRTRRAAIERERAREQRPPGELTQGDALTHGDPRSLTPALSAWMALWFWPTSSEPNEPGERHDPPTPETLSAFVREAASEAPSDPRLETARRIAEERRFLHFDAAFPAVFARERPGFDAIVGNPPWVAYAGRAAQPLDPSVFNVYLRRSPAFRGYRSLHGLFVHRCASLLRAGGRLGLVLPTSVSDLEGYEATRRAHDALCVVDDELPDFGSDAFEGVFQPAMGLISTRRSEPLDVDRAPRAKKATAWPLARSDLDAAARGLFARLSELSPLPASLFGERGFQTNAEDGLHLRPMNGEVREGAVPIREGTDIGEFIARPPRLSIDVTAIRGRFRNESEWGRVRLLLRQTARYPIAALADGLPFRNSILAAFDGEGWTDVALLCYLNSSPIRWFHYVRNRDARQGMPQVKIAHLRALPSPGARAERLIGELGSVVEARLRTNAGISEQDRGLIEEMVAEALDMTAEERDRVAAWAAANPIPKYGG